MRLNSRDNDRSGINRRTVLKSTLASSAIAGGLPQVLSTNAAAIQEGSVLTFEALEGRPSGYERGEELGVFIWKSGDRIQVRMDNEGGDSAPARVFAFSFTTNGSFSDIQHHNWNNIDQLKTSDSSIEGRNRVSHFSDGFSFKINGASELIIDISMGDGHDEFDDKREIIENADTTRRRNQVYFGADRTNPQGLPITIVGDVSPSTFEEAKQQKLELAASVTDLSATIDEEARTQETLEALSAAVEDGSVEESTAIEAAERLKIGENITEATLSIIGPSSLDSPESPKTLVGAPNGAPAADGSYNLAGRSIKNAVELVVLAATAAKALKSLMVSVSRTASAAAFAEDLVNFATSTLLGGFEEIVRPFQNLVTNIINTILDDINNDGVKEGDKLAGTVNDLFDGTADSLSNGLLSVFEQSIPGQPLDNQLSEFDTELGVDDGGVTLNGDLSGAESAASAGIEDINEQVREFREDARILDIGSELSIVLGAVATILTFSGLLAPVGALLTIVSIIFGFTFEAAATIGSISNLADVATRHDQALDNVVTGTRGG